MEQEPNNNHEQRGHIKHASESGSMEPLIPILEHTESDQAGFEHWKISLPGAQLTGMILQERLPAPALSHINDVHVTEGKQQGKASLLIATFIGKALESGASELSAVAVSPHIVRILARFFPNSSMRFKNQNITSVDDALDFLTNTLSEGERDGIPYHLRRGLTVNCDMTNPHSVAAVVQRALPKECNIEQRFSGHSDGQSEVAQLSALTAEQTDEVIEAIHTSATAREKLMEAHALLSAALQDAHPVYRGRIMGAIGSAAVYAAHAERNMATATECMDTYRATL